MYSTREPPIPKTKESGMFFLFYLWFRFSKVVIAEGWQWGQAPIVYKMPLMARISNSLWQLSPAPSLLVWLRYKPSETATTDRRRGEGGLPGAWKPVLLVDGAHQSGKTVHLREGKLRFQTSTALRPYPLMGKALGVNPEEKSGAGVPKAVRGCIQQRSGNSCNGTGTMYIGAFLSSGPFQWHGEGGWGVCCMGNSLPSILTYRGLALWRGRSATP